jgi:hypothetical protein
MRKVVPVRFALKVFGQPASFSAGFKTQDIVTNCVFDPLGAAGKDLQSSRSKGLASVISFGSRLRWVFGHAEKFEEGALKDLLAWHLLLRTRLCRLFSQNRLSGSPSTSQRWPPPVYVESVADPRHP